MENSVSATSMPLSRVNETFYEVDILASTDKEEDTKEEVNEAKMAEAATYNVNEVRIPF